MRPEIVVRWHRCGWRVSAYGQCGARTVSTVPSSTKTIARKSRINLDELFVKIQGQQQYLWRAVDEDGDVLDILVQSRRRCRPGGPGGGATALRS